MRRLLVVTSSYAPVMIADMQRARMLAWDLPTLGWEVEVLAPNEELQRRGTIQPDSNRLFNPDVIAHSVAPDEAPLLRFLKIRSIGWRAFRPLYRKGLHLLRTKRFDLIYISTAQFNLFCLGRLWRWKAGVPYVLDFHDPWVKTDNRYITTRRSWKSHLSPFLGRIFERFAVNKAAGIVSVSPNYLAQLRARHPNAVSLQSSRTAVIPFGAIERDIVDLERTRPSTEGPRQIVYVGAGGSIMAKSFERICRLMSKLDQSILRGLHIDLYGTDTGWDPSKPKTLELIAARYGLEEIVSEYPTYISYLEAIAKISAADGLLILGVDDPAYMPSKLFLYALMGKPLLVSLHHESQANRYFQEVPGLGHLIHFDDNSGVSSDEEVTMEAFLAEIRARTPFDRKHKIEPYLSPAVACQHAEFFDRVLST